VFPPTDSGARFSPTDGPAASVAAHHVTEGVRK
jgi:hypothetical protein